MFSSFLMIAWWVPVHLSSYWGAAQGNIKAYMDNLNLSIKCYCLSYFYKQPPPSLQGSDSHEHLAWYSSHPLSVSDHLCYAIWQPKC